MKKIIFAALALSVVAFAGCKKDDDGDKKGTVTITGADNTIAVTPANMTSTQVKINITASEGIENLLVKIESTSAAFNAALAAQELGGGALAAEFDIANPGPLAPLFTGLNLKNGADVKGKTSLEFDITSFVPMMGAFIPAGDFNASFKVTAKDPDGTSQSKTINMTFTAGEAI